MRAALAAKPRRDYFGPVKVTFLGHAGLYVKTRHGSILCDPWFNSAFFASWFPFPSNEGLDPRVFGSPDYLYISHVHEDHLDRDFLREHVSKDAAVILPDHPLPLVRRELEAIGFTRFIETKSDVPLELDGLRVMTVATVHPEDGPLGDSALAIDDGEVRILDQNDARPVDMDGAQAFGHFLAHFVQFSGAIWYPMRYRFPPQMKSALGRKKREMQMARSLRYSRQIRPDWVVPMAGPPCFLDDEFFDFNDFGDDPANVFPDQTVYLEYMRSEGADNGRLMIPGSVAHLAPGELEIEHASDPGAIFADKRPYLEAYRERMRPRIEAEKASWPRGEVDILPALREWFEPVLELADRTAAAINGRVLLDCGSAQVVIDFWQRRVYAWDGEPCEYGFIFDQALVEQLIKDHEENWVDRLFLSCRFEAERKGAYNEYVYSFLKCLSAERMEYAEGCYAEQVSGKEFFECAGYLVQRRCPHMKGDLARFAEVEDGILTCTLHGWRFELATGRCLTSEDRRLFAEPIAKPDASLEPDEPPARVAAM
jgi:UDP-MurNAc hydroxylase